MLSRLHVWLHLMYDCTFCSLQFCMCAYGVACVHVVLHVLAVAVLCPVAFIVLHGFVVCMLFVNCVIAPCTCMLLLAVT